MELEPRTRAWSIVAMSLLCVVLAWVLLRTPPHPGQHLEPTEPTEEPSRGNPYRGWPLFQGWQIPQPPDTPPSHDTKPSNAPQQR
ncbi:hypothetical protein D7Y27_06085 [Corallococcus sp. AB004]|uniref:hypothetical protein n=1 Tax=Corallococcus TaxID=83461 RepID=UPI000EA3AA25|nr:MULTISPECIES: hypothetical protein [Corallococcus]NPC69789.1 hypothetical protein [Corallococcus exiguus]RKH93552.1 hypothetical protein D7Y04_39780 [Corallococcus sp. AB038B]RKI47854.1 hypothetical protein D7Y27_06085 [Corallococcus sp. AB004]